MCDQMITVEAITKVAIRVVSSELFTGLKEHYFSEIGILCISPRCQIIILSWILTIRGFVSALNYLVLLLRFHWLAANPYEEISSASYGGKLDMAAILPQLLKVFGSILAGNLLVDALVEEKLYSEATPGSWTKYSVGIWNGGGIRISLASGNLRPT